MTEVAIIIHVPYIGKNKKRVLVYRQKNEGCLYSLDWTILHGLDWTTGLT